MTLVDESVQERLQAESAEDFINRFVRPNIVTLSTINKMLEEVELAAATRDKLEITLLLWSMTAIFTLVSWLLTDVWDVDEDLVQHIHHYWVGNGRPRRQTHVSIDRQPMLFDLGLTKALALSDFVHGLRVPAWP
eukprot:COSAG06_NODE_1658_length_8784_cov_4.452850_5_plen_135_part_00